jgi:ABC-2 type transport system permease protein
LQKAGVVQHLETFYQQNARLVLLLLPQIINAFIKSSFLVVKNAGKYKITIVIIVFFYVKQALIYQDLFPFFYPVHSRKWNTNCLQVTVLHSFTGIHFKESNFQLIKITTDKDEAMQMLEKGEVDVVQVVPDISLTPEASAPRPELQVFSRAIDPSLEAWARSLAYGEMNFINQQLLSQEANLAQEKAREVAGSLDSAHQSFSQLSQDLNPQNLERARAVSQELNTLLVVLLAVLPPESLAQANLSPELSKLYRDIEILSDDLQELNAVLGQGELAIQIERLNSTTDEIEILQGSVNTFVDIPPENIVSPVQETYTNLRGGAYSLVIFYAPAVLALLVQQLAITLASLGLVRERQMGSFEMFRVSPLKF